MTQLVTWGQLVPHRQIGIYENGLSIERLDIYGYERSVAWLK